MRELINLQLQFGQTDISAITFNPKSRDEVPQLLRGLQYIYCNSEYKDRVFTILEKAIPNSVSKTKGRPGLELWKILVMGTLRINLNCDFDHIHELVNEHRTIRQMLGHGMVDDMKKYELKTIKNNVSLLTPEILDEINQIVVSAGHNLVKKKDENLHGSCDSFVVETNVHYPTDLNLLYDSMRVTIRDAQQLSQRYNIPGWRQSNYHIKQIKKSLRSVQQFKRTTSKNPEKAAARDSKLKALCTEYLMNVEQSLVKVIFTLKLLEDLVLLPFELDHIKQFIGYAQRLQSQVAQRILQGQVIAQEDKIFSVFQPHTEWISKGKAGVPFELGLNVCILKDQFGYILHHQVMQHQHDAQMAVPMIDATLNKFPDLVSCSYDKGFYSLENQKQLALRLQQVVMRKKGKPNIADKIKESEPNFIKSYRKHSAVESSINALEVHGLKRCRDHGLDGFKRYVGFAIVARNLQILGAQLIKIELKNNSASPPKKKAA